MILKAAWGLANNPLDFSVANIDETDANNELAVVEDIDDMCKFYNIESHFLLSLIFCVCF